MKTQVQDSPGIDCIYYYAIDASGNEVGKKIKVFLDANGVADISVLPKSERETFEFFGVPDELHESRLFPKDGAEFLQALLNISNGYRRYRLE